MGMGFRAPLWVGFLLLPLCRAQLTLGTVEGVVLDAQGQATSARLDIHGPSGSVLILDTDAHGRYAAVLPYGAYVIYASPLAASCRVRVLPLQTARCEMRPGEIVTGASRGVALSAYNAAQDLLFHIPAVGSQPLDLAALGTVRLPQIAGWPAAWTATTFHLNGMDATDSYQPGLPVILDDTRSEDAVIYREAHTTGTTAMDGVDVGIYLRGAGEEWHGGLATDDTGSVFAASNLPPPPDRGAVQSTDRFRWFTRDTAAVSGPITRWADLSATATAQWASQTAPLRRDGTAIDSRLLFGNVRGRVRLGRDQIDALYSGSRLDLTSGGWPAAIEAVFASRMMPSFYGVAGFENVRETDHLDFVQAGWTHQFAGPAGVLEARYQYSTAHLDTSPNGGAGAPVRIDLLDPAPSDAPLSNFAVRTRHQIEGAYQSAGIPVAHTTHRLSFGGGWQRAQPRNRFHLPVAELITTAGEPAYDVQLSAAPETRYRIDAFTVSAVDNIRLPYSVIIDLGLRIDGARANPISWTSPSPQIGLAVPVPGFPRLTLRGNYARTYQRLAGRYLDFANPQALSALVYDASGTVLLQRFGGAYSGMAPGIRRPYADTFHVAAELALPGQSAFSVRLLRRDDKDRIAAVNTGVPPASYQPTVITDPGADALPGTFDDQQLTVYAQSPATLGQDRYLLTNPAGLRELSEALIAAAGTRLSLLTVRATFAAVKSFGPTNPGNSVWVNDPGIVGALYSDPNSLIHATGHPYMDRAFIGKFEAGLHAPARFGGVEFSNIVNYLDGLPFSRQLLITGLPQGPFLVNATLRGSPEGGNRAEYVLNWNLRLERGFAVKFGQVSAGADLMNVLNNGNKIVESDVAGPQFNQRPAYAFPPPRTLRLSLRWEF